MWCCDFINVILALTEHVVDNFLRSFIFTTKKSIKRQIIEAFGCLLLISISITIMICFSAMYSLADLTYKSGSSAVMDLVNSDLLTNSREIGASIYQTVNVVSESIVMSSSVYAYSLLSQNASILDPEPSYREYNFVNSNPPSASLKPNDFGLLSTRSRFPNLPDFQYGSLLHSSVYLAQRISASSIARKATSADWNSLASTDPRINTLINQYSYLDIDYKNFFTAGPNTTVMFYSSAVLCRYANCYSSSTTPFGSNHYVSIHRTYPGIIKATPTGSTDYDPPNRGWFQHAPVNGVYIFGPYRETFTQQLVLTISSRSRAATGQLSGSYVQVVSAAVLLLDNIKQIIHSITYPKSGHGALVSNNAEFNLIVWSKGYDTFDYNLNAFKTLSSVDPQLKASLGSGPLYSSKLFEYVDSSGVKLIVSAVPFFESTDHITGKTTNALVMLVFARHDESVASIVALKSNIDSTTRSVTQSTLIILFAIAGSLCVMVVATIKYVLQPLEKILSVSKEIIVIAAEEEENKDYSDLVNRSFFDVSRNDEVGTLANEFFQVVCALHNKNVEKKSKPKYPPNPFHMAGLISASSIEGESDWEAFYLAYNSHRQKEPVIQEESHDNPTSSEIKAAGGPAKHRLDDLDVLGSLSAASFAKVGPTGIELLEKHVVEMDADSQPHTHHATAIAQTVEVSHVQAYQRVEAESNVMLPVMSERPSMKMSQSIATRISSLSVIIWLSQLVVMIITVVTLSNEGNSWMNKTTSDITMTELMQLRAVGLFKATFVESFFKEMTLNNIVFAGAATQILEKNLTRPLYNAASSSSPGYTYLPSYSYSMDTSYSSTSACTQPPGVTDTSGYFSKNDLAPNSCLTDSATVEESRRTSLLDFKYQALFYAGNILSNIQVGLPSGFMRQYPFKKQAYYAPSSCLVESTHTASCQAKLAQCDANTYGVYPSYDATCRSWYDLGSSSEALPTKVYFTYPRISSSGSYVITSYMPLRRGMVSTGELLGVANFNVLASTLSAAINSVSIMKNGYVYLIDSANTTRFVVHPKAPKGASMLNSAESFTAQEYAIFATTVLQKIQKGSNASVSIDSEYYKNGQRWFLTARTFSYGTVKYACIATLPYSDITAASDGISRTTSSTLQGMIAAFAIAMIVYALIFASFSRSLNKRSLQPFMDLQAVCVAINDDKLDDLKLPETPTSSDLKTLLDAFSNLILALRFGSESYARNDAGLLKELFSAAYVLFSTTANHRGVGASANNMGYVEMALGHFSDSERWFKLAIENAKELMVACSKEVKKGGDQTGYWKEKMQRAQRVLSDREGNMAVLYLEQQHVKVDKESKHGQSHASTVESSDMGFPEAFAIIENGLLQDKQCGHIKGIVVKQGTLGNFYTKQSEWKEAERIYNSCLAFIRRRDESLFSASWNSDEASAAEQIALYNLGYLRSSEKNFAVAECQLIQALVSTSCSDIPTLKKIFQGLHAALTEQQKHEQTLQVLELSKQYGFSILAEQYQRRSKRVVFILDYSGSMSGTKINCAVDNLLIVLDKHVGGEDEVCLMYFTGGSPCKISFFLMRKKGNERMMQSKADSLRSPSGGTNLYDAILQAKDILQTNNSSGQEDFIVVLTDGQDGSSKFSLSYLNSTLGKLSHAQGVKLTVLVIGVGNDVNTNILKSIADSTPKGKYIFAEGNKEGIAKAFSQVATLISGQVVLEDI